MQWNHTSHSTNFFPVAVALSPAVYVKSHLQHFIHFSNVGHFPADISILQNSCGVLPATLRISKATICHGDGNKKHYKLTLKPVTSGILNSVHMGCSTPIFKLGPHSSFVHRCIVDKTVKTPQTAFVAVLPKLMSPGDKWTNKYQLKKRNTYRCSTIFSRLWCSRLHPCEDCTPCWLHHWRPHQVLRRGPQYIYFTGSTTKILITYHNTQWNSTQTHVFTRLVTQIILSFPSQPKGSNIQQTLPEV